MYRNKTITVVIPAHNEAPSIAKVVTELVELKVADEAVVDAVVVCSNASTDNTAALARNAGALVVSEPIPGYGRACLAALDSMPECDAIVFVDGDYSVHTNELPLLLDAWLAGAHLVIGARNNAGREHGALTPHQILGNQFATWLMRHIWGQRVTDLGPLRVLDRNSLDTLHMRDVAYGWTVEMQAKALAMGMSVAEVPVATRRRLGTSKVSGTWRGSLGASWGILSTLGRIAWRSKLGDL